MGYFPAQSDMGLQYDKILDLTTTGQSWTPNSKYKYYMIVVIFGGWTCTEIVPPDLVGNWFAKYLYYSASANGFLGVNTALTDTRYSISGTGYTVTRAELRGYY